ncbi:60S ribosomal protein L18a-like protein [Glycine soja]|uniref:60S ribosomal protein L18a-like protein n=2 Tax=Glycine subgen. Soja TaxID=1462606 RepID=A0A0R0GGN5_SOYBN|nr:60S ribosomal protein L18a-like protein [Glycine soja]
MTDEDKPKAFSGHHHHPPPPQPQPFPAAQYGTFQGVANYPPPPQPHPAIGFPHPVPPPGAADSSAPPPPYYPGYQAVPGYAVAEGRPVRERHLGCCGLGCGWCLFILGFFLAGIPWYVGAIIMLCSRVDYREKPGYIACVVAVSDSILSSFHLNPVSFVSVLNFLYSFSYPVV